MHRYLLALLAVLSLAMMPLLVYKGPVCSDVRRELGERVKAFITMHVIEAAPVVSVEQACGLSRVPDPVWFFFRNVGYQLGLQKVRPFSWQDLRLKPTQVLLQHPDLGVARWDIRLDAKVEKIKKQSIEDMLGRYLEVEGHSSRIEIKRLRTLQVGQRVGMESTNEAYLVKPFSETEVLAIPLDEGSAADRNFLTAENLGGWLALGKGWWAAQSFSQWRLAAQSGWVSLGNSSWLVASKSRWNAWVGQGPESWKKALRLVIFALLVAFSYFLLRPFYLVLRKQKPRKVSPAVDPGTQLALSQDSLALLTPYYVADWRQRSSEMFASWYAAVGESAGAQLKLCFETDPEACGWALVHGELDMRRPILAALSPEQIMSLEEFIKRSATASMRSEVGGLTRFILFLARELGKSRRWPGAPLYLHCISSYEWGQLASNLTRSRRRWLSQRLNAIQAEALRREAPFDWNHAPQSQESEGVVLQKVRALLDDQALALRECIGGDREALAAMDAFFSQLSTDGGHNAEIGMLLQAGAEMKRRSFAAQAANGDSNLTLAMQQLDPEAAALALFDCDGAVQSRLMQELDAEKREAVAASLRALQEDRSQLKKWRMRSRSLQRFLERQVLVAQLFVSST